MKKSLILMFLSLITLAACSNIFVPEDKNISLPDTITIEEPAPIEEPAEPPLVAEEEPIVGLASQKCFDTDGGVNIYVAGTVTENNLKNTDSCEGLSSVNEYSCSDGHIKRQVISCGLNKECQNSVCVQSSSTTAFKDCTSGTTRCDLQDALYLDTCVDGMWKRAGRCPAGCANNECVTQQCYAPGTRCNYDGTAVETCNVATGLFKFEKTCRFGCSNGKCNYD